MIGRYVNRAVDAQSRWSRPFGDFNHRWLGALFHAIRPIQHLLNGSWLGHPIHAVVTDVAVGALTVSIVADLIGQPLVADVSMLLGVLAMLASAVTGAADYAEVDGTARYRATVHMTIMVVTLVLYIVSLVIRNGQPADRLAPILIAIVAYLLLSLGAAIGGDLVYLIGTHVNRNAWRGAGLKWVKLDLGDLPDIPEGGPTKLRAGINDLAVIRNGEQVLAVHAVCAHAGGPLPDGTIVGDTIQCPWHGSRFRLADGHIARGPAMYDQPAYEVRRSEAGGGWEVRRRPA
ncbi:MAG TPA: Rieske 2Fe-2S domain-containing protein [Candidatus Limnocylindrales bacterium]|nr:Rieske 2Fe-2S domain-containing protein [Candidatus Limnocylindrales bacterium]